MKCASPGDRHVNIPRRQNLPEPLNGAGRMTLQLGHARFCESITSHYRILRCTVHTYILRSAVHISGNHTVWVAMGALMLSSHSAHSQGGKLPPQFDCSAEATQFFSSDIISVLDTNALHSARLTLQFAANYLDFRATAEFAMPLLRHSGTR
jgi:hypothetical protein